MKYLRTWQSTAYAATIVVALSAPVAGQTRSWLQTNAAPNPRTVAQVAARPSTLPPQVVPPQPIQRPVAAPYAQAPHSGGHYPLPNGPVGVGPIVPAAAQLQFPAAAPTTAYAVPANAYAAPTSAYAAPTSAYAPSPAPAGYAIPPARSPYVAPYYTAQNPTPAPPIPNLGQPTFEAIPPGPASAPAYGTYSGSPQQAAPIQGGSFTGAPGYGSGSPYGAPAGSNSGSSFAPIPEGSDYGQGMASSCEPGEPAWEMPGVRSCGPWFFSVAGLYMTRDVPNNVELASLGAVPQISVLNSEQAGINQWRGGVETRIGRSIGERWAIEGVYSFIDTYNDQIAVRSDANDINSRLDFENLFFDGAPLSTVFDNSREQRFLRENIFENIEINFMQQALTVDPASRWGMTSFIGARYFRFDELIHLEATAANVDFTNSDESTYSDYRIRERNRMIGGQIGSRITMNLGCKWRFFAMPRIGVFANNISQFQHVCQTINMSSEKVDVTLMGQLDLGASYQVLPCVSLFATYRAMGFAGVASADDNIARTFLSPPAYESINSSGSLILHGLTAGVQAQF